MCAAQVGGGSRRITPCESQLTHLHNRDIPMEKQVCLFATSGISCPQVLTEPYKHRVGNRHVCVCYMSVFSFIISYLSRPHMYLVLLCYRKLVMHNSG